MFITNFGESSLNSYHCSSYRNSLGYTHVQAYTSVRGTKIPLVNVGVPSEFNIFLSQTRNYYLFNSLGGLCDESHLSQVMIDYKYVAIGERPGPVIRRTPCIQTTYHRIQIRSNVDISTHDLALTPPDEVALCQQTHFHLYLSTE